MDILWIILGCLFLLVGLIGCLLPILPGPPLSYIGLLLLQLTEPTPFTTKFMVMWLIITIAIVVLDYVVPAYGTRRYGGSRWGVIGTIAGLIAGIFIFPPFGIIIGPIVGALLGEYISGKKLKPSYASSLRIIYWIFVWHVYKTNCKRAYDLFFRGGTYLES